MADLFHSARLTFAHAKHHIDVFKDLVEGLVKSSAWAYVVDKDSKPGKHVHKIKFTGNLPEILPCIVFDAASNLRAVLDQVGYASALAAGAVGPKSTQFPFGDDAEGVENIVRRGRCKDLPPVILTLFRGYKPYKGGNDTLWALNKLCNTKKHCALVPLYIPAPNINFTAGIVLVPTIPADENAPLYVPILGRGWDAEKREAELAVCPANIDPQIRAHVAGFITIESIEILRRQDARRALDIMGDIVQSVLSATEAECRRLFPKAFN